MVVVPGATPVALPVNALIVAAAVLLLVHVPPPASDNGVLEPTHALLLPDIAAGSELTTTGAVILQPVPAKV
jgi:hypothetical protein